jgi:ribonuclease D
LPDPARPPDVLVQDIDALHALVAELAESHRVAFDTESASFHRYVDRVYLIQLSTDHVTALVDPLRVADLGAIGTLLADPTIEIVFHDADYDLRVLDRDYGFRARNIFDTRVAAQLAGESGVGLSALLERHFGIRLDKRLQRADWSERPLTPDMVAYAADDTRYLLRLRDLLAGELERMRRRHWLKEECSRLEQVRWGTGRSEDGAGFLRLKGARALRPQTLAVLERVYAWRDALARELDRAPFRVLSNHALIAIARAQPRDLQALAGIQGVGRSTVQRHGQALLTAVAEGLDTPADRLPVVQRTRRPTPDPAYDARLERLKSVRTGAADRIGMDPGLVCPNGTLQAIARLAPLDVADLDAVTELRTWQREVIGDRALVAAARDPSKF